MGGVRILFIGSHWPEPRATGAGRRLIQLIEMFQQSGNEVHFATAAPPGHYPADLHKSGVHTHAIRLNHSDTDRFLKDHSFEWVVFDRYYTEEQFGWRVREQLPDCKTILDTEDLHSLRQSREESVRHGMEWTQGYWVQSRNFARELASILRCDLSLLISRAEISLLSDTLPWLAPGLFYLPFQTERPDQTGGPGFTARRDFVFIGNGKHAPNVDAAELLIRRIWPDLSKLCPAAELHIYGAYLPDRIRRAANGVPRLSVHGWTDRLPEVLSAARLQLAPLRFGAGVKSKIIDGLAYGLPTLTTAVGSEGIFAPRGPELLEAEIGPEFIRKAEHLYSEEALWEEVRRQAWVGAGEHFRSDEAYALAVSRALDAGTKTVSGERALVARLLKDQALDSSRYLARWIEEKEKNQSRNSS